jgi:hypothetical protein
MTIQLRIISYFTALFFAVESKATVCPNKLPDFKNFHLSDVIALKAHNVYGLTGYKMNLRERIGFSLLKRSMKRSMHKKGDMSFREFISSRKKDPGVLGGVALIIGGIILLIFFLFVILYKD